MSTKKHFLNSKYKENLIAIMQVALYFVVILLLAYAKEPRIFHNFWAEDGSYFINALSGTSLGRWIEISPGYWTFSSVLLGNALTLFPILIAPTVNCALVAFTYAILIQYLKRQLSELGVRTKSLANVLAWSILLLPIGSFETFLTGTSLHFIFIFASLISVLNFLQNLKLSLGTVLVWTISIASDPMAIVTFLPVIIICKRKYFVLIEKKYRIGLFLLALVIQLLSVFSTRSYELRINQEEMNLIKVMYLFLDRVVGSMLVPNWGVVVSADFIEGSSNLRLWIRGVTSLCIWILISLIVFKNLKNTHLEHRLKIRICWLFSIAHIYWFFLGALINPEPRYALVSSLMILTVTMLIIDNSDSLYSVTLFRFFHVRGLLIITLILTWVFPWNLSEGRTLGPKWRAEIERVQEICVKELVDEVRLVVFPKRHEFIACRVV